MDIIEHHCQNFEKAQDCFIQLQSMDIVPKSKMFKIYRNVSKSFTELDKEFVECRRLSKLTAKYETLEKNYYECITAFEQWSIMAALTY